MFIIIRFRNLKYTNKVKLCFCGNLKLDSCTEKMKTSEAKIMRKCFFSSLTVSYFLSHELGPVQLAGAVTGTNLVVCSYEKFQPSRRR